MLERYYVRPKTIDRIRSAWIGPLVDQYATWMLERGYSARNLAKRASGDTQIRPVMNT
jgi:hypothetical protein